MKICLFGKNLTNLILSQVLIKKGISVHMYYQKKNKLAKINYNRTIGLSFENIKFLKKYDIDVEKIGQKISKIFLYKNDSKETFLKFDNKNSLFFIVKNHLLFDRVYKKLKKRKDFKESNIKKDSDYLKLLKKKDFQFFVNSDTYNIINKKFFFQNIKKDLHFKQIKTNISKFIGEEQFRKSRIHDFDWLEGGWFSIKDVNIYKDQIYVSYTREVKENCWNTSLLHGKMNLKLIIFQNLFTSDECVHFYDNIDGEFNAHQSGGRIINVDDQNLFFSTGDFRSRFRAQKEDSIFSKIIEINKNTKDYKVVSMGHRNPQGLYYNKKNNFLLEAEHGPEGGDEINLIELKQSEIPNYGWAISSYGEHYGGKNAPYNKKKYVKYPLHKSHSEYNFIEPLIYFNPSIGISQIVGLDKKNSYVVASMKDESLYFFEYDYDNKKLLTPNKVKDGNAENIKIERVHIGERIRDMIYYNEKLYLYLEDTASIAEVYIN